MMAAAALLFAACGGSAATTTPPGAATPGPAASASGAAYQVKIAQDAKLGAYLSGEDGRSLYLLTADSANTTTCTGACAAAWPPFELEGTESVTAGDGVTGTLATIRRADDGKMQVTYNGIPVYYFAKDANAGDINGQAVKGVWFLVAPAATAQGGRIVGGVGEPSTPSGVPSAAPSQSPASGGYGYRGDPSSTPAPAPSATAVAGRATSASVRIVNYSFSPATLTVKVGTTVIWTNGDPMSHTVTADNGAFDSGNLAPGATFRKSFTKAGTFAYHCAIHSSMTATITVTP